MPKIVQFMDVSSYSQSHYIEVPQEGVSSRAKQNWLWIFIFVRKQIQIYFLDFLVKTQISNCFVLFLTQNPKIHTNLLDSPCENTDANEFIWFYLSKHKIQVNFLGFSRQNWNVIVKLILTTDGLMISSSVNDIDIRQNFR